MASETDSSAITGLLHNLSDNMDHVENALDHLLSKPLSVTTGRLPLLDKAKLYVHTAYAIESLIFSHLRLSGVDAKSHQIMPELGRVRAYFEKIKAAEASGPSTRLDKEAAQRFIKHALSGNEDYDLKRKDALQTQETGAKRKADELAERYAKQSRFEGASKRMRDEEAASETIVGAGETATSEKQGKSPKKKSKGQPSRTVERPSKHKKKSSRAPKDSHQAFESLLSRSAKDDA